jgi:hypothetical protein
MRNECLTCGGLRTQEDARLPATKWPPWICRRSWRRGPARAGVAGQLPPRAGRGAAAWLRRKAGAMPAPESLVSAPDAEELPRPGDPGRWPAAEGELRLHRGI